MRVWCHLRMYSWVRKSVVQNRTELLALVDAGTIDGTVDALKFWVEAATANKIGWAMFVAVTRATAQ